MTHDATAPVIPDVSVQVDDVDACHAAAVQAGAEIVYPLTVIFGGKWQGIFGAIWPGSLMRGWIRRGVAEPST